MENKQITNWNTADKDGTINVPDYLDPAINYVGTQLRFHTVSGKNEAQTICDIVAKMEEFFKDYYSSKNELIIDGVVGRSEQFCSCSHEPPIRRLEDNSEVCCECEKELQ